MPSTTKNRLPYLLFLLATVLLQSCDSGSASEEARSTFDAIIPKPVSSTQTGRVFSLSDATAIFVENGTAAGGEIGEFLAEKLRPATGFALQVTSGDAAPESDVIVLTSRNADPQLGEEGYALSITEDRVVISAPNPAGLFFGVQTLRQLFPHQIESSGEQNTAWNIAAGTIRDYPAYAWRGSMLDVARHFFAVEDIKRYIDLMSYYKMNRLHLHLSDDQGWRIEIKSWPNLTEIGSRTQVGGGKGGYYTQEQYKDIVRYAEKHYITIVPEIDLPGHINAALTSYPELLVNPTIKREPGIPDPKEKPVPGQFYTGIQVGFSTLDIRKPRTFQFVEDVLRELSAITPGPYLHIGGDEAAVTKKPDYIAFINRFREIVRSNGKIMIGWEEIAQGDLDSAVIVQHWHSQQYAKLAAAQGARLIYSPSTKVYLDMQYDSTTRIGLHWAAYIEVDDAYDWDPRTHVDSVDAKAIVGVEAPLWTETVENMNDIEYLIFPRLPGVAEIGWTPGDQRKWDEYRVRLGKQAPRWTAMGIDFYRSPLVDWATAAE